MLNETKEKEGAKSISPKELRQQMRAVVKEATANFKAPSDNALEAFMRYYTQSQQGDYNKAQILEQLHDLDPSVNTIRHLASLQDGEALQNCATLLIDYAVRCPDLDLDESETPRTMASIINLVVSLAVDARRK
tara:strand:+ start:3712 stop:4113 length:402 start_codon:yes stop_codon:yes gene_type:complete